MSPPSTLSFRADRRRAFTLIELLVSMTVMTLLIVLVTQLLNSATAVTSASTRKIDSDNQARIVFNRMSYDFSNMLLRKDIDCFFVKNSGTGGTNTPNDAMYFYSESPAYFSNNNFLKDQSPVSLIGYRVANRGGAATPVFPDYILERVARGVLFDGGAIQARENLTFLTFPAPAAPVPNATPANPLPVPASAIPHSSNKQYVIGTGPTWDNLSISGSQNFVYSVSDTVFRMEFCFLMKDPLKGGATTPKPFGVPVAAGSSPWTSSPFMVDDYVGKTVSMRAVSSDVAAVVVTIATMDTNSRLLVNNTQLAAARDALPDGDTADVVSTWQKLIANTDNANLFRTRTGLPKAVISQMHVYQRFFYLNSK